MRIYLTGGGTGGHVYPGLAVAEALEALAVEIGLPLELCWVGGKGGMEADLVARQGIPFHPVASGALRGTGPVGVVQGLLRLQRGFAEARELLGTARPDAIMATGGYVSVPLMLAASREGVPALLYLPDMEPGWAVRLLARWADRVAVSFGPVKRFFAPEKVLVSGYPVRRALLEGAPFAARRRMALNDEPVLLVFGGSRGARSINDAVRDHLAELLDVAQVIHVCGYLDYEQLEGVRQALEPAARDRYHLSAYLHDGMTDALLAADLVVARAGAGTLGEFPAVGVPAILVPYPYAGAHQAANAAYLAERGAAVVVPDREIAERLGPVALTLLNDASRRRTMAAAASRLAVPDAARTIARELLRLGGLAGDGGKA
ncbi:MAG: undecaprenyldiphospho-muramoylpentapeptide beta-N-acetylglucosaminyltransferase [Anaerolineae bacterium]